MSITSCASYANHDLFEIRVYPSPLEWQPKTSQLSSSQLGGNGSTRMPYAELPQHWLFETHGRMIEFRQAFVAKSRGGYCGSLQTVIVKLGATKSPTTIAISEPLFLQTRIAGKS